MLPAPGCEGCRRCGGSLLLHHCRVESFSTRIVVGPLSCGVELVPDWFPVGVHLWQARGFSLTVGQPAPLCCYGSFLPLQVGGSLLPSGR
jgi:hypothetical protein